MLTLPRGLFQTPNNPASQEKNLFFTSLSYIKDITPKLARILNYDNNFKIANKAVLTINRVYSNVKDKTPLRFRSDVVYSIPCLECDNIYIGQTQRPISSRITSHRSDCRLHPERCALASHANNFNHNIAYESVRILATEHNYHKRLFLEMAFIHQETNTMNKRTDINNLSEIYAYLLSLDKNQLNNTSLHSN